MNDIKLDNSIGPLYIQNEQETKQSRWTLVATFVLPALLVLGLLFLLVTLQGGLETGLANLTRLLPVGFAFAAGMVASVNPCGVLMLPSYALYQVGAGDQGASTARRLLRALLVSLVGHGRLCGRLCRRRRGHCRGRALVDRRFSLGRTADRHRHGRPGRVAAA